MYFASNNVTSFMDEKTRDIKGNKTWVILREILESSEVTNEMYDNNYNYSYEKGKRLFLKLVSISELEIASNLRVNMQPFQCKSTLL